MYIGFMMPDGIQHVTLTYHGWRETKDDYKRAVISLAKAADNVPEPIELKFGQLDRFEGAGVWVVLVDSDPLKNFRSRLVKQLNKENVPIIEEHPYTPHVTLSRNRKPVETNPYAGFWVPVERLSVISTEFGRTDILL